MIALSIAVHPPAALADAAAAVNDVRLGGCQSNPGVTSMLRKNSRLDDAARRLSRGDSLDEANRRAGYRAVLSASVRITDVPADLDLERIVAQRFCMQAVNPHFHDIGTYRRGADVWLVIAAAFTPPGPRDRAAVARRVLELTNEARANARRCGAETFGPAPALVLAPALEAPALEHSVDMAAHDFLNHTGHDGSSPAERVTRSGYTWRFVGENLASGVMSAEEAVNGWILSPHHCENLMNPRFSQMAVAYAVNVASAGGIFWTQIFGTPR